METPRQETTKVEIVTSPRFKPVTCRVRSTSVTHPSATFGFNPCEECGTFKREPYQHVFFVCLFLNAFSYWTTSLTMYSVGSSLPNASYKKNMQFPNQITILMKLVDLECQLFTSCTFNFLCFVCRHYHYNSSGLNIEFLRLKFKRLPFEFRAVTFRSIFTSNPVHLWFTTKNRCIIRLLCSISMWVTRVDVNLSVCVTDTYCEYA